MSITSFYSSDPLLCSDVLRQQKEALEKHTARYLHATGKCGSRLLSIVGAAAGEVPESLKEGCGAKRE